MAPTVSIRKCSPGDEAALSMVGQASFLEAFAGILDGSDVLMHCQRQHSAEKYRSWLIDPRTCIWVAEIEPGSAPVGYLVLTDPDLPLADITQADQEIKRIYLMHRFQGLGIGKRLMSTAHEQAKASGTRRLLLGVYGQNKAAIAFYESLGYRAVGTRPFKVGSNTYADIILAFEQGTP